MHLWSPSCLVHEETIHNDRFRYLERFVLLPHHVLGITHIGVFQEYELRPLILKVEPLSCFDSLRDWIHHHHVMIVIQIVFLLVGLHLLISLLFKLYL